MNISSIIDNNSYMLPNISSSFQSLATNINGDAGSVSGRGTAIPMSNVGRLSHSSGASSSSSSSCRPQPCSAITTPKQHRHAPIADPDHWNPFQKLLARLLDAVERSVISPMDTARLPLSPSVDPKVQLAGNFFPVAECPVVHEVPFVGELPACLLGGVYVRNGANPRFEPTAGHHVFDGDGMLHAVSFHCNKASAENGSDHVEETMPDSRPSNGRVSYASRFVKTYRLSVEEKLGRPFFPKAVGELHGSSGIARLLLFYARAVAGLVDLSKGTGVANAGLVFFNGKLLAMSEDDLPYSVRITRCSADIDTVGRYNFDAQLSSSATMIAHPKLDPDTGELFTIGYSVVSKPYLKYFKFSPDGIKDREVSISLPHPTLIHDIAITSRFVVIPDQQVIFHIPSMLKGLSPVVFDKSKTSRFGILPRDAVDGSQAEWIDVPDCFCFHLWNAWEDRDGEEMVILGSCMTPPDGVFNGEQSCSASVPFRSILSEVRLDLRSKKSTRREIVASMNLEAGQINRRYIGKRSRYAYFAITDPWPKVSGIAKVDLTSCWTCESREANNMHDMEGSCSSAVSKFMFEEGCYGGEPMFVPSCEANDVERDEDDGYVLTFMHDEGCGKSELLVLDAKSPSLDLVARVKLPTRVPFGFHGTFMTCRELEKHWS